MNALPKELPIALPVMVVDGFTRHAMRVRQSALASGFGTWSPTRGEVGSSVYTGMNFWGEHAPMIAALTRAIEHTVYPNSMFFRVTNADTEAAYVHSDREAGDFTCIAYLSAHAEKTGTAFYRHRETGMTRMPSFAELAQDREQFERLKADMVSGAPKKWEELLFVDGAFNRAVIFHAPLFHARIPKHGFAVTPEEGRMVWSCHFMADGLKELSDG